MNAKRVNAAAGVVHAAMQTRQTAAGIAAALEAACLLQSPETAAELVAYRALELGTPEGRISAKCEDASHPVWLRDLDDTRGCPWCRVAELEAERHSANEVLSDAAEQLRVQRDRIAELEAERDRWMARADAVVARLKTERHSTNEALSDAAAELNRRRDRIAELEAAAVDRSVAAQFPVTAAFLAENARPTEGELAEQRHLVDPLDHALEALAPRSVPIPRQQDRRWV